jgi:hypothetical protein
MISIDPGLSGCGVAYWTADKKLQRACYVRLIGETHTPYMMAWSLKAHVSPQLNERVVIEKPQVYQNLPVPPADLIDLHEMSSIYVGMLGRQVEWVHPHTWKGSVKKAVMTARIPTHLTVEELPRVERVGAKDHNTWDAVGIGLWALGRFDRKRVIAR